MWKKKLLGESGFTGSSTFYGILVVWRVSNLFIYYLLFLGVLYLIIFQFIKSSLCNKLTFLINIKEMTTPTEPEIAKQAVLVASSKISDETPVVSGYEWNNGIDYDALLSSYLNSGFQATNFGKAVQEINKMVC